MADAPGRAYVGTSGWKKPWWRGDFYPKGLVQRRELEYASRQLTSLEINATFHGLQRPSTFANWRNETPDGFVFAVKGHKLVTHTARFRNARANLADFFASGVLELGQKLGPILWQLPPELSFQPDEMEQFLRLLPVSAGSAGELAASSGEAGPPAIEDPDRMLRHAVEARNPSFISAEFMSLLRSRNIAAVIANDPELPIVDELTADFAYARLTSGEDHHSAGYDDSTLDDWAARIDGWTHGVPPRDTFVYFKNPAGELPHTPHNASRLIARLGADVQPLTGRQPES